LLGRQHIGCQDRQPQPCRVGAETPARRAFSGENFPQPPSSLNLVPRVVKVSGHSGIELEQSAQAIATVNGPALRRYVRRRNEEKITFALVIAFKMMMFNVLSQGAA
jgi:hypothetical protein